MLASKSVVPQPTVAQIENKWKTLLAAYKRARDHNNISGNCRRGCAFQEELDKVLCSKANIRPKLKGTVGKVVTLQDSSEDEGDQVKTIPLKRKPAKRNQQGQMRRSRNWKAQGSWGSRNWKAQGRRGN